MIATLTTIAMAVSIVGAVELAPCSLDTPDMPRVEARCGAIKSDDGVSIGFAILEATDAKKKRADPLVLLPGGPGQAATELAGFAAFMFAPLRATRDVILFDPRGTGRSHKLTCPALAKHDDDARAKDAERDAAELRACAASLDLDPRSITTARIAHDLDELRAALGYESWNLVGISYGTRVALEYDRNFHGRAKSMVLDGPVPFSMNVGEHAEEDADAALIDVDARYLAATTPPAMREAPRNASDRRSVRIIGERVRADLDAHPRDVVVRDPRTNKERTMHLDGAAFGAAIHGMLYAEETAALIPVVIAAADHGDFTPLAAQMSLAERLGDSIAQPMQLSVLCAEDAPFFANANAATDARRSGASGVFRGLLDDVVTACRAWPHADVPRSFHDVAPTSTTPALVLAGTADPVTPARAADDVLKTVPKAIVIKAHGLGHNIVFRQCIPRVTADFLDNPATYDNSKSAECAARLRPFPVFIDAMGPSP